MEPPPSTDEALRDLIGGVQASDRGALGRAITLVESTKHRSQATQLLQALLPHTGKAHRIGITGVPGVGKSTFIETLGVQLVELGHRVAVVAVDPSSPRSGGSILADKTRMSRLARDDRAFIRPVATGCTLGGVGHSTRETILLLEAAGYDIVIVETVGVGQSETLVAAMVDTFLVLMLAGAGDDIQGIKRGVLELADLVAVNKADGDNVAPTNLAAADYRRAIEILAPPNPHWRVPVVTCSSLQGLTEIWQLVQQHHEVQIASGEHQKRRNQQQLGWLQDMVKERLLAAVAADSSFATRLAELELAVEVGELHPTVAVELLFETKI